MHTRTETLWAALRTYEPVPGSPVMLDQRETFASQRAAAICAGRWLDDHRTYFAAIACLTAGEVTALQIL